MADAQPQRSSLLPAQVVPDSVLVRQARAGDQQAFELLVSRYHGPLTSYIRSLLNDGDQVAEDGVRLLTLTGPAGVGKTRLALAAVTHFVDVPNCFPDGVIFVDLTSVRDPALVLNTIARSLGLLDVGSRPALERLQDALAERQQLIVLDNFEQVLPSAAQIAELLASCSGLALLVTSRVALQLRWEQTLRIAPLPVPDLSRSLPPLRELVTGSVHHFGKIVR